MRVAQLLIKRSQVSYWKNKRVSSMIFANPRLSLVYRPTVYSVLEHCTEWSEHRHIKFGNARNPVKHCLTANDLNAAVHKRPCPIIWICIGTKLKRTDAIQYLPCWTDQQPDRSDCTVLGRQLSRPLRGSDLKRDENLHQQGKRAGNIYASSNLIDEMLERVDLTFSRPLIWKP